MPTKTTGYWAKAPTDEVGDLLIERIEKYYKAITANGQLDLWRKAYDAYFAAAASGTGGNIAKDENGLTIKVNHLRNLGQHILATVTRQKLTFQPKAQNTDAKSIAQTQLASGVLEYAMSDKGLGPTARETLDQAIALSESAGYLSWDEAVGDDFIGNDGVVVKTGGPKLVAVLPTDLVKDHTRPNAKGHTWYVVRTFESRWDLIAKYAPEVKPDDTGLIDEVLVEETKKLQENLESASAIDPTSTVFPTIGFYAREFESEDSDLIPVWNFYHRPTPALPKGRHVVLVDADTVLVDEDLDGEMPVYPLMSSPHWGRPNGYTSLFDILSLQTGINALYSAVATNNTLATQNVAIPNGAGLDVKRVNGINLIKFDPKAGAPTPLNLTGSSPETYKLIDVLERTAETLSGVNSTTRGNPEANLKSGAALALVQSMTLEFAGPLQANYMEFVEAIGTGLIKLYQKYASAPQVALIVGKAQQSQVKEFTGNDLNLITRVFVEAGNPLASSLAGRAQIAEQLLSNGLVKNAQEYLTLLSTGRIEVLTEGENAVLLNIRAENELLRDGKEVIAMALDDHPQHIKEHYAILSDPKFRNQPDVTQVEVHIQDHIRLWSTTDPVVLQALGIPPLQQPPPPGGPGGAPPQGGAAPSASKMMDDNGQPAVAQMPSMPTLPDGSPAAPPVDAPLPGGVAPPADA